MGLQVAGRWGDWWFGHAGVEPPPGSKPGHSPLEPSPGDVQLQARPQRHDHAQLPGEGVGTGGTRVAPILQQTAQLPHLDDGYGTTPAGLVVPHHQPSTNHQPTINRLVEPHHRMMGVAHLGAATMGLQGREGQHGPGPQAWLSNIREEQSTATGLGPSEGSPSWQATVAAAAAQPFAAGYGAGQNGEWRAAPASMHAVPSLGLCAVDKCRRE
jgi:hypothetical protein